MQLLKKADVSALTFCGKDPCVYWGERGFGCRVYASGRKTWVLSYRKSGKKRLFTFGEHPGIQRKEAEDLAASYRIHILNGSDPALERRVMAKSGVSLADPLLSGKNSVNDLCDTYLALHAPKKRSGRADERLIDRFIRPTWGVVRVDAITRRQVTLLHASITIKTPVLANRVLAILKTMMTKASLWGLVPENHPNPAMRVPMNKEQSRERFISIEELPRLANAIETEKNIFVRGILWLYLLTGARKSELLEAQWHDVDLQRQELHIPRPKQGKPHVYPLTGRAMEVLLGLPRYENNPYLFPGRSMEGRLVNISKPWNRVRTIARLPDVHLHDLRRSVGSWLAADGFSLISIGKVLGHSSPRTTQIYARLTDTAARDALESHSERMNEVLRSARISDLE